MKKKSNKKFRIADVEDDDDRSESCKSDNSRFSQKISSIESQGEPELLQFSQLSSLNSEECSSATAIDLSIKKHKKKTKRRQSDQMQKYGYVGVQSLYHGIFTTF